MIQITNYPKVYDKYKNFIRKLLGVWVTQAQGSSEEDITDEEAKIVADTVIQSQPRLFYDFLDESAIYVSIQHVRGTDPHWDVTVDTPVEGRWVSKNNFPLRKDAEFWGFEEAVKLLEEIL